MAMKWIVLGLALVGCGGSDGANGGGDGGEDSGLPIDGPPVGTPLVERIGVTTITTPAGVMAGDQNYRIWGRQSLRVAPVFTVPFADCGTLVGYTTGTTTPTARVARLDANDALVATYDLGAFELRGLAAEPDGHFAALLWDTSGATKTLRVTRFDASGGSPRVTMLTDSQTEPTDFGIGESRLEYGGGKYGAYYHVHGVAGQLAGHEGDALKWVDAAAGTLSNGWTWGCSHSMSELLRYAPGASKFLAACVTDCFPGTSGDFATSSIGGIYLDHTRSKVLNVDAACNGNVAAELGSMAPAATGWKLVFNAHQNAATMGSSSYNPSTMNQDIGFASIGATGTFTGSVAWLTTTAGNEANASIARWEPVGEPDEQYVVGWAEVGAQRAYKLARVSAAGAIIEAPLDVSAIVKWGERDDPFRDHLNGDIVWAWFDAAGATTLKVARLRSDGMAQCAAF